MMGRFAISILFADAWLIMMNGRREVLESASVCVEKDRIMAVETRQDEKRRTHSDGLLPSA